jgi:hypothetical protein
MSKPPHLTKLKALTSEGEVSFKEGLGNERDAQQANLDKAREMRTDLSLKTRDRYIDFLQKLGELSLTFGAAMIPLIIATNARKDIKTPTFALLGAAMYLMNGVLGIWLTKMKIEQDADDTPFIGLNEEIMTYPLIYAKNKLILEPNSVDFANEHIDAEWNITNQPVMEARKKRPSLWTDVLSFNFVVASILIAGTLWPYKMLWYWLGFVAVILVMLLLIKLDYKHAVTKQQELEEKRKKLAGIKSEFGEWRNNKMAGN